jgi:hypothetical protein
MPTVGFELTKSACERPQNYAWDRDAIAVIRQYVSNKEHRMELYKFYWNIYAKIGRTRSNHTLVDK